MKTDSKNIRAHLGVAWSLLWRATLLGPVCMLLTVLVIALGMGLLFFPIMIALSLYAREWMAAALFSAAWIAAVAFWFSPRGRRILG